MIIVDSSAVVEWLIKSSKALRVELLLTSQQSHAPQLIGFEVLSAIRGHVRASLLTPEHARSAMLNFEGVEANLELWPLLEDMSGGQAVTLRENVSAYDAAYVSLADLLKCPLVTADARLARAVERHVEVTLG